MKRIEHQKLAAAVGVALAFGSLPAARAAIVHYSLSGSVTNNWTPIL